MTAQLELDLFETNITLPRPVYIPEPFHVGEYAIVSEICADGYFLWERCYVHEVLSDGYRVEICEGIVCGRLWSKDGTMITVSKNGLSRYDAETHYRTGAHWVPQVEWFIRYPDYNYDTHSALV